MLLRLVAYVSYKAEFLYCGRFVDFVFLAAKNKIILCFSNYLQNHLKFFDLK